MRTGNKWTEADLGDIIRFYELQLAGLNGNETDISYFRGALNRTRWEKENPTNGNGLSKNELYRLRLEKVMEQLDECRNQK